MTSDRSRSGIASTGAATVVASAPTTRIASVERGDGSAPRFEFSPHNCFACGSLNAHGLGLVLHVEHGRCWTELALEPAFEGWEGIAHGGIICTILDEVMAWSLIGADNWGVTARMAVEFRRPVPVGRAIRAEGTITRERSRTVETAGRLVDGQTGEVLATATGTYVAAGEERKRVLRERYGFRLLPDRAADGASSGTAITRVDTGPETGS